MKKKVITITLILILAFSFALTILPSAKANPHTDITVTQAASMIYSNSYPNLVIMDVRIASDYNTRHIPGAINVPVIPPSPFDFAALNAWISSTEGQSHKNHEIIVYCASGTRSNLAADILDSNGFTKVYDMRGAFPAWTTAGYPTTGWTLVTDARAMKAYPDLKEYVWQKNATMPPNGQYDKIGLHRLVNTGIVPKGVVFITNCPSWGTGEERISNPPTDNWTKYENFSQAIYWANRGFDVYAIDYRTHFAPKPFNATQASYAANWGWDVWISDIKDAAEKVKEVSGSSKFFISGECSGGEAALNYATKYASDLNGIVLLDANVLGVSNYPIIGRTNETNSYNLTQAINKMNTTGNWTKDDLGTLRTLSNYALQNPSAPAQYPPGTPLNPPINPLTNKTWANITEWYSWLVYNNFGVAGTPPGMWSNLVGGYGNISQFEHSNANSEFVPLRLYLENIAMADWVNCPDLTYDYNDHYSEINVPILAFEAGRLVNATGTFRFVNGTASSDFTGIVLPNYGHTDLFYGAYSARDVSEPAYKWMINHTLPTIIFSSGFEDGFDSWTATHGGVSIVSSPVYSGSCAMKCSDSLGSQATKSIGTRSKTYTEAQFYFDQNFVGSQALIAYFNASGSPTASMGLSVQSGKLFAFVQTTLPSYSYSQYQLTSLFPETWYKFALDASAGSATIYLDDQQLAATSLDNIPATASASVGMFWGDGSYKGSLYIDSVQIGTSAPQPTSASVFSSGFEDSFNSWTSNYGGVSVVSSPVYSGNCAMKCSDPWGSQATKSLGMQSEIITEAEFYFDGNVAGEQTLIAYFNANGNPTVSMGILVQSGRVFVLVEDMLPSYVYSQYELTGVTPGTWYKFALGVSATSATVYMYNQKLTSVSQTNIPATASVRVGMFWGDGNYKGNLYIDSVQIGILPARARPGVNKIDYYNAGGKADIPLLPTLPTNYPASATNMRLLFIHSEIPDAGTSFNVLVVEYYVILTGQTEHSWQPLAYVTTSADEAAFAKILWRGSLIEFDATTIGLPASFSTDNVKLVSEGVLTVERHGNSVNVNLNAPQQIKRPTGPSVYFTLPAFSLQLNGYGGSVHTIEEFAYTGYTGASGYIYVNDATGFNANGVFTCTGLALNTGPVSNAAVAMKGTHTFYLPS